MLGTWPQGVIVVSTLLLASGCGALNTRTALPPGVTTTTSTPPPTTTAGSDLAAPSDDDDGAPTTLVASQSPVPGSEDEPDEPDERFEPMVADELSCEPSWAPLTSATGEVTFARGGDVFTFDPASGELRCLAQLTRDPRRLDWNPAGGLLLVDEDLVVGEDGQQPSGFAPGTVGLSWSHPTGGLLLAPSADGSALRKVDATDADDVTDVTAIATTWAAAYHPSGEAIVSAGVDGDGTAGLFIADSDGNGATPLVVLADRATTITDVVFAHNGNWITFVHDLSGGDTREEAHIHRLHLTDLPPEVVPAEPEVVPTELIASEQFDGTIAWREEVDDDEVLAYTWAGGEPRELRFPDAVVEPVGVFAEGTTAAVVTPQDRADEAGAQLWTYPPEGEPVLIANAVTAATTRTIRHDAWSDPPTDVAGITID